MVDPRLNSLHLDPIRRQDYRRAREALLHSRGHQTYYAERQEEGENNSPTMIRNDDADKALDLDYWLADKDFIYPLKVGVNTLGRASDNDVVVSDSYVSRRHCAVLIHHNRSCELHDTASKNGTYLNGVRLTAPALLKSGDELRICDHQFVFLARHSEGRPTSTQTIGN
jgi:hypothetical protein